MSGAFCLFSGRIFALFFLVTVLAGCASNRLMPNNASDLGLTANGAVPGSLQDFQSNVGNLIYFETDSSVIGPEAAATLDRQVAWLQQYPDKTIMIEGHADERGTREYNLALGGRRAAAAREYLISKGLPPQRVQTLSLGKERPVAVCDNISCWSQNRRAETILVGVNSPS